MQLSDKAIEAFRAAYKADFKKEISFADAREMGTRLMTLMLLVSRQPPKRAERPEPPTS